MFEKQKNYFHCFSTRLSTHLSSVLCSSCKSRSLFNPIFSSSWVNFSRSIIIHLLSLQLFTHQILILKVMQNSRECYEHKHPRNSAKIPTTTIQEYIQFKPGKTEMLLLSFSFINKKVRQQNYHLVQRVLFSFF